MGEAARASLVHHGWEQVVGQFEACLLEALDRLEQPAQALAQGSRRQSILRPLA
jgi:hypothetical protein